MAFRLVALPAIVCASLLAACSGSDRTIFGGNSDNPPPASAPAPAGPAAKPPPVNLAGRWTLSAIGSGSCAMTFGASSPESTEGTIAPAGGCPFNFFTSRKWTFEHGALIIRDHKSEVLAELSFAAGRFEGHQAGGGTLSLSR